MAATLPTACFGRWQGILPANIHAGSSTRPSRRADFVKARVFLAEPTRTRKRLLGNQRNQPSSVKASGLADGLKDFFTGSAAHVDLISGTDALGQPSISTPFDVIIRAEANSAVEFKQVYLKVRSIEALEDYPVSGVDGKERVTDRTVVFDTEIQAAGPGQLAAGEQQEWTVQVLLPEELCPSFQGRYIRNVWEFEAGLGTGWSGGINPSSGWRALDVSP
uniref:Uncharacterized protein n=1 Tax=Tetraselmis sp. GSL018 TaxID=582737 RepID=A0A061R700_9CHLO